LSPEEDGAERLPFEKPAAYRKILLNTRREVETSSGEPFVQSRARYRKSLAGRTIQVLGKFKELLP
jgi:hypothetical protein